MNTKARFALLSVLATAGAAGTHAAAQAATNVTPVRPDPPVPGVAQVASESTVAPRLPSSGEGLVQDASAIVAPEYAIGKVRAVRQGRGFVLRIPVTCVATGTACALPLDIDFFAVVSPTKPPERLVNLATRTPTLEPGQSSTEVVAVPRLAKQLVRQNRLGLVITAGEQTFVRIVGG